MIAILTVAITILLTTNTDAYQGCKKQKFEKTYMGMCCKSYKGLSKFDKSIIKKEKQW